MNERLSVKIDATASITISMRKKITSSTGKDLGQLELSYFAAGNMTGIAALIVP